MKRYGNHDVPVGVPVSSIIPSAEYLTYWISRDSDENGVPCGQIDLWITKPVRYLNIDGKGHYWLGTDAHGVTSRYGVYELGKLPAWIRTVPDDDLQLIVVG